MPYVRARAHVHACACTSIATLRATLPLVLSRLSSANTHTNPPMCSRSLPSSTPRPTMPPPPHTPSFSLQSNGPTVGAASEVARSCYAGLAEAPGHTSIALTTECVRLLQNVFSYYRMCSLVLLQNAFSYTTTCSLPMTCVSYCIYEMCSMYMKCVLLRRQVQQVSNTFGANNTAPQGRQLTESEQTLMRSFANAPGSPLSLSLPFSLTLSLPRSPAHGPHVQAAP